MDSTQGVRSPRGGLATSVFVATHFGAAVVGWSGAEWIAKGKPSALGAISGAVAGLVAITPASGFVTPMSALVIGMGIVIVWVLAIVGTLVILKFVDVVIGLRVSEEHETQGLDLSQYGERRRYYRERPQRSEDFCVVSFPVDARKQRNEE